jgi:hypothetical protein
MAVTKGSCISLTIVNHMDEFNSNDNNRNNLKK